MMMDNWRRKERGSGNYSSRGVWRQRSSANRPPPSDGYKSVPSWERKFCESVGLIPWRKLLDAKKFMHLYEDVVNWNDAAGEEAFKNAKSRYWAEINGLPCNTTLPDPDIYIDRVDWDAKIDPELLLDLEREPEIHSQAEHDTVILGKPSPMDGQDFTYVGGWDDPVYEEGGSKGWNNWNDGNNVVGGWSDPWQGNDYNERKRENNGWERERSTGQGPGHWSFGKRGGNSSAVNRGGYGWNGGCKGGGRGSRVEAGGCEQPRWAERRGYCGRW